MKFSSLLLTTTLAQYLMITLSVANVEGAKQLLPDPSMDLDDLKDRDISTTSIKYYPDQPKQIYVRSEVNGN